MEVFEPTVDRLRGELGQDVDPVQAYCDYIEVKWLLSEQAGHDVGDDSAIRGIAEQAVPVGAAAGMAVAEESPSLYEQLYAGP